MPVISRRSAREQRDVYVPLFRSATKSIVRCINPSMTDDSSPRLSRMTTMLARKSHITRNVPEWMMRQATPSIVKYKKTMLLARKSHIPRNNPKWMTRRVTPSVVEYKKTNPPPLLVLHLQTVRPSE